MNFDIETPAARRKKIKKKKEKRLLIVAISLAVLSLILVIIYFAIQPKKEIEVKPPKEIDENPIKIVDLNSDQRPVAVMIDNNVGNNQHAGLQDSYINYEIIVEGGLTRIMAVYKDKNVDLIGPVRSSRHYFLDYALESDAIYTHYGWSPYAQKDIKALGVNNLNGLTDTTPFWRDSTIAAPHNVFTSTERIRSAAKDKNYASTSSTWLLLNYSVDKIDLNEGVEGENVLTANNVSMSYSNQQTRGYKYDAENNYYLRTMNNAAHVDKNSGAQLHYRNIIIQKVNNHTLDKEGRQDLTTTGVGTGYFITDGYAVAINWTKSTRGAKTNYTYTNGTELKVNDGNTFIQIVPAGNSIAIE